MLFLDYDGTLTPIQKDPSQCILSDKIKEQLQLLADSAWCDVSVLSGRVLADIKKKVGLSRIYYGGNHGLDISGPHIRFTDPKALSAKPALTKVKRLLTKGIRPVVGVWLEDKRFSLSLHFRSADKDTAIFVKKMFYAAAAEFLDKGLLAVLKGKKVLELVPNEAFNKGMAVRYTLKLLNNKSLPIYIGDDQTDETAFKALKNRGITIRIGRSGKTSAHYYLKGTWEVPQLLVQISNQVNMEKAVEKSSKVRESQR